MKGQTREGQGRFICGDKENGYNYEYEGQWKNNLREGQGRCFYYNGDLYVGMWKQGKRHRGGTQFYRKLERYEGEWQNDMRDGGGILWSANNTKYVGTFKRDKKHGTGEIVFPDGTIY